MSKSDTFSNKDHGGRRAGLDRRYFSYSNHIPERRKGEERRIQVDRRSGRDRRDDHDTSTVNMDMRVADLDRRISWNAAGTL